MINRNLARILSKRYLILASVLFLLAFGLLLLPQYEKNEPITVNKLLAEAISLERYITADELAEKIINKDPSFFLVDIRSEEEYNNYTLPNAIGIPFEKLLEPDFEDYLDQDQYEIVLFSNDNFKSDQAWLLLTRAGYTSLHVLKDGINGWYHTILNPPKPEEGMPREAFLTYNFRKAAALHFGAGVVVYEEEPIKPVIKKPVKKVVPVKKKKKRKPEGGC